MGYAIFNTESLTADINGIRISGVKSAAELYLQSVGVILSQCPSLLGEWEARFTTDSDRASKYQGKENKIQVQDRQVYVNGCLNNKAKGDGIRKLCKMAGWDYSDSVTGEDVSQPASVEQNRHPSVPVEETGARPVFTGEAGPQSESISTEQKKHEPSDNEETLDSGMPSVWKKSCRIIMP